MTLVERIFALRAVPALAELSDTELAAIAEAARERTYPAGALVCPAGRAPARLLIVCAGAVVDAGGRDLGCVPGAAATLFNRPLAGAWSAGPNAGARCLQIARSHLATIVQQCPVLVVGLLADQPPAAPSP